MACRLVYSNASESSTVPWGEYHRDVRRVLLVTLLVVAACAILAWAEMIRMPGASYSGALPPLSDAEKRIAGGLSRDVHYLAGELGERNTDHFPALASAADYVERELAAAGYTPKRQPVDAPGKKCDNIEVRAPGASRPDEIIVVGAHYDSAPGSPGADDNASGVAAMLALARALHGRGHARTLAFVGFVNEEPPHFQQESMGSLVYARRSRARGENIVAMLSLESLGYYDDSPRSQQYPAVARPFYPRTGNFVGFVGNVGSRALVRRALGAFRTRARFPSEGAAMPELVEGVGWSDQWSFWRSDYQGIMVTDTAPFRYPHYHTPRDTPEKVDYERLARVVTGLEGVLVDLAE